MRFLELLFAVLKQFINFPGNRLAELQNDATKWEAEQTSKPDEEKNGFVKKGLEWQKLWYVQVFCAILFLVSIKSISNWLMSNNDPADLDEENEEKEVPYGVGRKFNIG